MEVTLTEGYHDSRHLQALDLKKMKSEAEWLTTLIQGKAKEAFAQYPWFTTEGEPFVRLDKPAAETRFGLITTGGYSIEGEQEPMRGFPTFGDEVPQIRRIPTDVDRSKLQINHPGYDHKYAKELRTIIGASKSNRIKNDGLLRNDFIFNSTRATPRRHCKSILPRLCSDLHVTKWGANAWKTFAQTVY